MKTAPAPSPRLFRANRCTLPFRLAQTGIASSLSAGVFLLYAASGPGLLAGLGLLGLALLSVSLLYPHHYRLTDRHLVIRSGLLRFRIALDSILEVMPPGSPGRSRAHYRVRTRAARRLSDLAPLEPERFLEALGRAAPALRPVAGGLRRIGQAEPEAPGGDEP